MVTRPNMSRKSATSRRVRRVYESSRWSLWPIWRKAKRERQGQLSNFLDRVLLPLIDVSPGASIPHDITVSFVSSCHFHCHPFRISRSSHRDLVIWSNPFRGAWPLPIISHPDERRLTPSAKEWRRNNRRDRQLPPMQLQRTPLQLLNQPLP